MSMTVRKIRDPRLAGGGKATEITDSSKEYAKLSRLLLK
jgi:hypothetical protein